MSLLSHALVEQVILDALLDDLAALCWAQLDSAVPETYADAAALLGRARRLDPPAMLAAFAIASKYHHDWGPGVAEAVDWYYGRRQTPALVDRVRRAERRLLRAVDWQIRQSGQSG